MSVIFPSGTPTFTDVNVTIENDGYITSATAGDYYLAIQGRNKIGYNLPYFTGKVTVPEGGRLEITVSNLKWAEEWIYLVVSYAKVDDVNQYRQCIQSAGKFAGSHGELLAQNFKSANPPRNYWDYNNYAFQAPYIQGVNPWKEVELQSAGTNLTINDTSYGLDDTYSLTAQVFRDEQLKANTVATINDLPSVDPTNIDPLYKVTGKYQASSYGADFNGVLYLVEENNTLYELDVFDSLSIVDNDNILPTDNPSQIGRWKKVFRLATTDITDLTQAKGCNQDLESLVEVNKDNKLLVPNYFIQQELAGASPPVILWYVNNSETTISKFNRVVTNILIGNFDRTDNFYGKVAIRLLGYVNLTDFTTRITRISDGALFENINRAFTIHSYINPILLPDDVLPNEAIVIQYELLMTVAEFKNLVSQASYLKIIPSLVRSVGVYIPGIGQMLGRGMIFADGNGYMRRVVPDSNNSILVHSGSGIVQGFGFPKVEAQVIANIPQNTDDLIVYITGEGYCFVRDLLDDPPPSSGYAMRAIVSTMSGKGDIRFLGGSTVDPSTPIKNTTAGTNGITARIQHHALISTALDQGLAQIRGNYPDVVKGFPCKFNPTKMDVIVAIDVFASYNSGTGKFENYQHTRYLEYHDVPIQADTLVQTVEITDTALADVDTIQTNNMLPEEYNTFFGLYAPPITTVNDNTPIGNLPLGNVRVTARYIYDGSFVSAITHDPSVGCLREFEGSVDKLLEDRNLSRYWDLPVTTVQALKSFPINELAEGKIVLIQNPAVNRLYRFTYNNPAMTVDDEKVVSHNDIADGVWLLIDNTTQNYNNYILDVGDTFDLAPWGDFGLKVGSGRYSNDNLLSTEYAETIYTESSLVVAGMPADWNTLNTALWLILTLNDGIVLSTNKNSKQNYPNSIIIGKLTCPNEDITYFHDNNITITLDETKQVDVTTNYANLNYISNVYMNRQLRGNVAELNAHNVVIALEEVNDNYVYREYSIQWDDLTYIQNTQEYLTYLAITEFKDSLETQLSVTDKLISDPTTGTELSLISDLNAALTALSLNTYTVNGSLTDWENYLECVYLVVTELNEVATIEAFDHIWTPATDALGLANFPPPKYEFYYKRPITYSGGTVVNSETSALTGTELNLWSAAYNIGITSNSSITKTKTIRNTFNQSEYLFEPPNPDGSVSTSTIGTGTSDFPKGQVKVYLGYEYEQSNRIFSISQSVLKDETYPIESLDIQETLAIYDELLTRDNNLNTYTLEIPVLDGSGNIDSSANSVIATSPTELSYSLTKGDKSVVIKLDTDGSLEFTNTTDNNSVSLDFNGLVLTKNNVEFLNFNDSTATLTTPLDISTSLSIDSTQILTTQQPAVDNLDELVATTADNSIKINEVLDVLRVHGLIAT